MSDDLDEAKRELALLKDAASRLPERAPGVELALGAASAEEGRAQLEAMREELESRQRAVQAAGIRAERELEARMAAMKTDLERVRRELAEAMGPIKAWMRQLKEGLWMVELYLGTHEQIQLLRDGAPAAADTPISVRQLVLAMDEEAAHRAAFDEGDEKREGWDWRDVKVGKWDEWLLADPAHLQQVLPEERGVVAMVPRKIPGKSTESPWEAKTNEEENAQTYFLFRNGEQLYRIWTNFNTGDRLTPTREEYAELFYGHRDLHTGEREALRPGSGEWDRAEAEADARGKHYMRVSLILQGIVDRTTVWHPTPAGANFMDEEAAKPGGPIRFIQDAEDDRLLGSGRKPWKEYLAERMGRLTVGQRVVVDGWKLKNEGWSLSGSGKWHNPRLSPSSLYDDLPESGKLYTVEAGDGDDVRIRYDRTQEIYVEGGYGTRSNGTYGWVSGGYRLPKVRASAQIKRTDTFAIPFDNVREEELEHYLSARLERRNYVSMFPVIVAVLKAKRAEREEERPFVEMLTGVLARENGGTVAEAAERVPALVEWYKHANRHHRALKDDDANAVRVITAEDGRRLKARTTDAGLIADLRTIYEDAIYIGRYRGSGKYVILEPADEGERVYARRILYGVRSGPTEDEGYYLPEPSIMNRLELLWAAPEWEEWDLGASREHHLTGPERAMVINGLVAWATDRECSTCHGKGEVTKARYEDQGTKWVKEALTCESCGGTGRERTPPLAVTESRERGERSTSTFYVWVRVHKKAWAHHDERDEVRGQPAKWSRRKDGTIDYLPRRYDASWNRVGGYWDDGGGGTLSSLRKQAVWYDEERIADLEETERARKEEREARYAMVNAAEPYRRAIDEARKARQKAVHVAAFVEKYEYEELYEGHMKTHRDEAFEYVSLPGLREFLMDAQAAGVKLDGEVLEGVLGSLMEAVGYEETDDLKTWTDEDWEMRLPDLTPKLEEGPAAADLEGDGEYVEGTYVEEALLGLPAPKEETD